MNSTSTEACFFTQTAHCARHRPRTHCQVPPGRCSLRSAVRPPGALRLGALLLGALLATALVSPAHAQSHRLAWASPDVSLMMLKSASQPSSSALQGAARGLERSIRPTPVPQGLIDALRWSTSPERTRACQKEAEAARTLVGPGKGPSPSPDALFGSLLEQADRHLLDLQLEDTLARVRQAEALVPCLTLPVENAQVRALFLYEAVARFYQKDKQYATYFQYMLGVDNRLFLETDFPPKVQQAFLTVAKKVSRVPSVPFGVEGIEGTLWLDGRRADALTTLAPGRHILQQVGPLGEVRSQRVEIQSPPSSGTVPTLPLADQVMPLPSPETLLASLHQALQEKRLPPELRECLERYTTQTNLPLLGFLIDAESGGLETTFFAPGRGLITPTAAELKSLEVVRSSSAETSPTLAEEPERRVEPEARVRLEQDPGLRLTFGAGARLVISSPEVRVVETPQLPVAVTVTYPLGPVALRLEADLNLLLSPRGQTDCGEYTGETAPTEAEIDAALSCVGGSFAGQAGVGAGLELTLGPQLRLLPTALIHATMLPRVLVQQGESSEWQVHQALGVGPSLSARLSVVLPLPGLTPAIGLYVEPSAGLRLAALGDHLWAGWTASGILGGEVIF